MNKIIEQLQQQCRDVEARHKAGEPMSLIDRMRPYSMLYNYCMSELDLSVDEAIKQSNQIMKMKLDKESMPYVNHMKDVGHLYVQGKVPDRQYILNDPAWYRVTEAGDIEAISLEDLLEYLPALEAADIAYGLRAQLDKLERRIHEKITTQEEDKPF